MAAHFGRQTAANAARSDLFDLIGKERDGGAGEAFRANWRVEAATAAHQSIDAERSKFAKGFGDLWAGSLGDDEAAVHGASPLFDDFTIAHFVFFAIPENSCLPKNIMLGYANRMLRGYVRDTRRSAASTQLKALEEAGVTTVYIEGKRGDVEEAIRSLRADEGLAVNRLSDLANDRKTLRDYVKRVHDRGAYILEVESKRRSDKPAELADMIFDATDKLAQVRKGHDPAKAREYGSRGGRPGIEWTEAQKALIERHWYDMRHPTNTAAILAINRDLAKDRRRVTENYVWRMMKDKTGNGASGRVTGPRRKKVAKAKRKN